MPFIIDDNTPVNVTHDPAFMRGAVPRDFTADPVTMFADPTNAIPDMTLDEIAQRIVEGEEAQSTLRHVRRRAGIKALDQNGQGYCWAYSTGMVLMLVRARDNQPYVRFSPHAVACKIKGFRDEGGWCGLSAKFAREVGYPSEEFWPQKSMNRTNDNSQTWANAALHKTGEEWVDLARPVYDQNVTKKQMLTALVMNVPTMGDWNWWAHSTAMEKALLRGKRTNYTLQDFGVGGVNSWTENWGDKGEFDLWDGKSVPDGAVCVRTVAVSPK